MKRLSLFDQLQIRFPIRARTNVRRSAEAGAAAASMSKSGFGGSLLTNMAMSADAGGPFNRNAFVGREVYIERYIAKVGAGPLLQFPQENVTFLLLSRCSSLASGAFLSQWRFLAFRWNKSKVLCTIKMLSDLFHSRPEGLQAIYRYS